MAAVSQLSLYQALAHPSTPHPLLTYPQAVTRRLMAAVSELSLYQALALKYGGDREAAASALAAAQRNLGEGRPPTPGADKVCG